ncbi:hypothetical protein CDEST_07543 [Colletotrichum destructivum]|uniref:Extracellular membrane protein CFEM domain-containing protein n=1 Tax=Colletotrichum destructivum TaxID=34406 RepID=A0AAX4IGX8_9PEZI|nr:hypothetical protein CDEST_07543 [Colletotrichum destructivum]
MFSTTFRSPLLFWAITISSFLFFPLGSVAKTTVGALAPVSLHSELAYSTARACAAGCLVHNGIWVCGVNAGYQDLGVALQCGCQSINGCYCNTALASSATSYISSCVSKGCSKVDNWSVDLTSMLNLYDSYCATANAAVDGTPATTTTADGKASSPTASSVAKSPTDGRPAQTSGSGTSGTSAADTQQTTAAAGGDSGLSRSDIVALAASLGVGIPSMLIAALTLYFQIRKKRRNAATAPTTVHAVAQQSVYGGNGHGGTHSFAPDAAGPKPWGYP